MSDSNKLHPNGVAVKETGAGAPFRRSTKGVGAIARTDLSGTVNIAVSLRDGATNTKGNVSRSFTVAGARVSEVAACIERALFGESAA